MGKRKKVDILLSGRSVGVNTSWREGWVTARGSNQEAGAGSKGIGGCGGGVNGATASRTRMVTKGASEGARGSRGSVIGAVIWIKVLQGYRAATWWENTVKDSVDEAIQETEENLGSSEECIFPD